MICGYEFLLERNDGTTFWSQLHGNGGAIGNGALHVQDFESVKAIEVRLLRRVQVALECDGFVLLSNDAKHDEPLKLEPFAPAAVRDCRAVIR